MKKILSKYYCFFVPTFVTAFAILSNMARYDVIDDLVYEAIASSFSTNNHSEHLIFISVIIGYIIKVLYYITAAVNWISIVYLLVLILDFTVFHYILSKYSFKEFSIPVLILFQFYTLANLTFTTLAFFSVTAGVLWILKNASAVSKSSIKYFVTGSLLMLLGFSLRSGDIYYCLLLLFVPSYFFAVKNKKNSIAVVLMIVALLTVSHYSVKFVSNSYKASIPASMYYTDFQSVRGAAFDTGDYNIDDDSMEIIEKAGLTVSDLNLFRYSVFADKNVFDYDAVKAIGDSRSFNDRYNTNIPLLLKEFLKGSNINYYENFVLFFIIFSIISFILLKGNRLETLLTAVFTCGAVGYLHFRRRGLGRVTNPIVEIGFVLLLLLIVQESESIRHLKPFQRISAKKFTSLLLAMSLVVTVTYSAFYSYKEYKVSDNRYIIESIKNDSEHIYVGDTWSKARIVDYNVRLKHSTIDDIPIRTILGGWYLYSYYWYDYMEQEGFGSYTDSSISALLRDDVYYITANISPDDIVNFFNVHYQLNVNYKIVNQFDDLGFVVYDFNIEDVD